MRSVSTETKCLLAEVGGAIVLKHLTLISSNCFKPAQVIQEFTQ